MFASQALSVWRARVATRARVFVHLFSGYRREHDLQRSIEYHCWIGKVDAFCLSVDLCFQGEAGDLLDQKRIQWWRERILTGQVCGVGGAPPARRGLLPDGWLSPQ